MENKQIFAASDDRVRSAIDCQLEEFVILGIAASFDGAQNLDAYRDPAEELKEFSALFRREMLVKLWAAQNVCQFLQGGIGYNEIT